MVDAVWVVIAASAGIATYLAIPLLASTQNIELRRQIGTIYLKNAARSLHQFAIIRRVLSGYDILPITVDDEQKLLKVTLTSPLLGDDTTFEFNDPDNRIHRVLGKPLALVYEGIPAALDPELAELGHWVNEKDINTGLNPASDKYDPWIPMNQTLRLADPMDAYTIVDNAVDPEMIKTAEKKTKQRFSKYNQGVSPVQLVSGVLGFFGGLGGVMAFRYVETEILGGAGGGADIDVPLTLAIQVLGVIPI